MAMRDNKSGLAFDESLNAIVKDADTNATAVDSQGFSSVTHVVNVGAPGITFSTTHKVEIECNSWRTNIYYMCYRRKALRINCCAVCICIFYDCI